MQTLEKQSVLPVVGVIGMVLVGVVLIGLFGQGGSGATKNAQPILHEVAVADNDHVLGSKTAPIVIVEYADFQCPSCKLFSPLLSRLVEEEAGKVAVVYRYFTLSQHKNAVPAARAAEAAGLQGKFWEMHDMLFDKQTDWENLADTTALFTEYATTLGLDVAKFTADVASPAVAERVTNDTSYAMQNGMNHTPTLIVNGTEITNPGSYEALKALVEKTAVTQN